MRRQSRNLLAGALLLTLALVLFHCVRTSQAQTEFVRGNFFPAEMEFRELGAVRSEKTLENVASPDGIEGGTILVEAGCPRYSTREYEAVGGGSLSVEVATLKDPKASYSILTLLRSSPVEKGPPGQFFAVIPGGLLFAQGNLWVRIRSSDADLCRRVAVSVSNRIGPRDPSLPPIVKRMPPEGLDAASLRYFLGPEAFRAYGEQPRGFQLTPTRDLEVVQAMYLEADRSGILSLVSFPTNQVAQEYFDGLSGPDARARGTTAVKTFAKRAGPLVAILEGTFGPDQADKILGSLEFQYSIRWIYDKNNRSSATVWGVPVSLLGTVVRSLVLVALLCVASIFLGFGIAVFRIVLRTYAPGNLLDRPERTELIRLKLDEN
jgi:hypothetical protein